VQNFILNRVTSDRVIAISSAVFNNLTSICRVPKHRIVTIKNGVDTQRFRPDICGKKVRSELGIPPEAVVVGNTSRFEARKGYDIFLQVAALLAEVNPKVKFLAVGHGSQEQVMMHEIEKLKLHNNVIIAPQRLNMPEVLTAMDIFLFTPYWGEGLPCAVLEALASGLPVVASNVGVNPEIVNHGKTGYLPAPEKWCMETRSLNSQAFAKQVLFLVNNPLLAIEMGRNGRKLVLEKFDLQRMVEEHETLYERLVFNRV
jgi:glycosyltransferase involved in cell wall biosynthesis